MLYPELFAQLEKARWDMATDIPWDQFNPELLTDEQAQTIRLNAITEWSALPATEMFLRDNRHDSDFSAFMSIWVYSRRPAAPPPHWPPPTRLKTISSWSCYPG